mgnify:FL=1
MTHEFYAKYYAKKNYDASPQTINKASFFWNDSWTGKTAEMPTTANFYGYYPRPRNNDISQGAPDYKKTSIISQEDAAGTNTDATRTWNKLHYSFMDQTDDNMSWHDVMYALPEKEGANDRYGNQDKKTGESVQLHFVHAFSLLDIEVNKGNRYQGDCKISAIELSGSQVFTEGDLDIVAGNITPSYNTSTESAFIRRTFTEEKITEDSPLHKTMIVQPTQDGDNPSGDNRLIVTCRIDGIDYSCSLSNLKLVGGKKYKLKLTLNPSGIVVFRIWNGAKVEIGGHTYTPDDSEKEMVINADKFTVSNDAGYKIIGIYKNGENILENDKTEYDLEKNDGANTYYNIVACPDGSTDKEWYTTDGMQMHFDGIQNIFKKSEQDQNLSTWYDLSGNDNNGALRSFTSASGWTGTGLKFDGLDDIVYFSGKINESYTMEMYVCVEPDQRGAHPRFVAEGNQYPCFYFYGTGNNYDGVTYNTSTSRQMAFYDGPNKTLGTTITTDGKTLIQLDFAYDAATKELHWYVDGQEAKESINPGRQNVAIPQSLPTASIGNKISDNSRALAGTYDSFIIYKRALKKDEIQQNYNVNTKRYGTTK